MKKSQLIFLNNSHLFYDLFKITHLLVRIIVNYLTNL